MRHSIICGRPTCAVDHLCAARMRSDNGGGISGGNNAHSRSVNAIAAMVGHIKIIGIARIFVRIHRIRCAACARGVALVTD